MTETVLRWYDSKYYGSITETVPWWYDRECCGGTTVQKQHYGSMKVLWRHDREQCGGMTDMVLQQYVTETIGVV